MSKPPQKVIDDVVKRAREWGQHRWTFDAVIVALADEREQYEATLQAMTESHSNVVSQRDELVALLRVPLLGRNCCAYTKPHDTHPCAFGDDPCWEHRRRAVLDKYKGSGT